MIKKEKRRRKRRKNEKGERGRKKRMKRRRRGEKGLGTSAKAQWEAENHSASATKYCHG